MIHILDDVLRELLIRELPVTNGDVDITFDQPTHEWSGKLSRPTVNLFLHQVHENKTLREHRWQVGRENGKYTRQRKPIRVDLQYMITAWAADAEDEHRLLARTLLALFRHPTLPEEMLPDVLREQPVDIPVEVAQEEVLPNPAEIWSALDNEMRPAVACVVTLALDPYQPITGPLVRTRDLRVGQADELPAHRGLTEDLETVDRFWMVGGTIQGEESLFGARLTLVERGLDIPIRDDGRYVVGNLEAGAYTLELTAEGRDAVRREITVPSESYDIDV